MPRLTNKNYVEFAVLNYCNPRCLSANEFFDDLARIKYVKRLLNRYQRTGIAQERLVVNHVISIYNVFDIAAANQLLFFKCEENTWPALKAILSFLNYITPDFKPEISVDPILAKQLEHI